MHPVLFCVPSTASLHCGHSPSKTPSRTFQMEIWQTVFVVGTLITLISSVRGSLFELLCSSSQTIYDVYCGSTGMHRFILMCPVYCIFIYFIWVLGDCIREHVHARAQLEEPQNASPPARPSETSSFAILPSRIYLLLQPFPSF